MSRETRQQRREASDASGSIEARDQIVAAISWISANIGENVPMRFEWSRTGASEFPLISKGDWSAIALFGKYGRFQLSAANSPLPVESVGFNYKVEGDDVILDADPVRFKGLASFLNPQASQAIGEEPSGFDPITIAWSVFSILSMIWSILHPRLDLLLGGDVSCEATLHDGMLDVKFEQMPSVRLTVWVTMMLGVRGCEISPDSVKLLFKGEGLIAGMVKERTFQVV